MSNALKRYTGPDLLKYLCCFFVIFIHTDVPAGLDVFVLPVARIAVPVFFMITGFFYRGVRERGGETRQLGKVCGFVLSANLLHIGWDVFKLILRGQSVGEYFSSFFGGEALLELLVFNRLPYRDPLWYLNALLYVLALSFVIGKVMKGRVDGLHFLIPLLLVGNILLGTYSGFVFNKELPVYITRNFLFCGLPYFLLGDFFRSREGRIKKISALPLVILFAAASVGESILLTELSGFTNQDHLITTFFLSSAVFVSVLKYEEIFAGSGVLQKIAALGAKHSFVIYIIHPIILEFWMKGCAVIAPKVGGLYGAVQCAGPVAVLVASTAFAVVFDAVKRRIKKKAA